MWSLLLIFQFHADPYKTVTSITGFLDQKSCIQSGQQIMKDFPNDAVEFDCVKVYK
jgi:hypothetical protein